MAQRNRETINLEKMRKEFLNSGKQSRLEYLVKRFLYKNQGFSIVLESS